MKRILTIAFISFLYVAQAQQRETRKITALDGISAATSLRVEYVHANRNEVVIETDHAAHLPLIETNVKNGVLYVQYKRNSQIKNGRNNRVIVYSNKFRQISQHLPVVRSTVTKAYRLIKLLLVCLPRLR